MYVPPVGQTAGPNKMKFFVGTHGNPGVTYFYFFEIIFSHGQRLAFQVVIHKKEQNTISKYTFSKRLKV